MNVNDLLPNAHWFPALFEVGARLIVPCAQCTLAHHRHSTMNERLVCERKPHKAGAPADTFLLPWMLLPIQSTRTPLPHQQIAAVGAMVKVGMPIETSSILCI